jgi:hypothetical protein
MEDNVKPRPALLVSVVSLLLLASVLMSVPFAIATTATWSAKAPMPTARTWISVAAHDGNIFVFWWSE